MVNGNLQKEGNNQFLRWRIRSRFGIIAMALGFALIVWVVDALLDYFVFYKGHGTFLEILVTHLPAHEIYIRLVILVCFVVFGVIVSFHISKRKLVEEKLKKSNRLYATLSQINQAIVREREKQNLFQEICNIAIEFGKFRFAWIGLIDKKSKLVKPVAYSGEGSDYLQNIEISITDGLTGKGPSGRSIREGKSIVFNDLENNPDFAPWRKQALERGYRSSASFPIRLNNIVIGVLGIYAVEAHFFDEDEVKLLEEAALDISFALEKFKEEENRQQTELALEKNEARLLTLMSNLPGMAYQCEIDEHWTMLFVNDACEHLTGYSPAQLIYNKEISYNELIHPDDREFVSQQVEKALNMGEHFELEYRIISADNKEKWVWERGVRTTSQNHGPNLLEGVIHDITGRKEMEAEIQKYQAHLEELVKERTKKLEEKNKQLERFNNLFVRREFRIKELREKVKELEQRLHDK